MDETKYYVLRGMPFSLVEYLRNAHPSGGIAGKAQRNVCARIMQNPVLVGLEAAVEIFEDRPFIHQNNKTICCPDFIAFDSVKYFIIEVGYDGIHKQLDTSHRVLHVNFGLSPILIAARILGTQGEFEYSHRVYGGDRSPAIKVESEASERLP